MDNNFTFLSGQLEKEDDDQFKLRCVDSGVEILGGATHISDSYLKSLDYILENHLNTYSLFDRYKTLRNYEELYNINSSRLFESWKKGNASVSGGLLNDWLTIYLQLKDYIHG